MLTNPQYNYSDFYHRLNTSLETKKHEGSIPSCNINILIAINN